MNKQKFNRKKYIIKKLFYILLMAFILFLPLKCTSKLAKHYLYDSSYQNILVKFHWRLNICDSPSEKSKEECSCRNMIHNYKKITNDGYLYSETELVGKMVIIHKPDFFNEKTTSTGGYMKIIDLKTRDICLFGSINI